jgi:hypothetical protein
MTKKKGNIDEIEKRLASGERKEMIFAELSSQVEDKETLGCILAHTPYPFLRNKYRTHSTMLAAIVIFFSIQSIVGLVQCMPGRIWLHLFGLFCFAYGFGYVALAVVSFKPAAPFLVSLLGGGLSIGLLFVAVRNGSLSFRISLEMATTIAMLVYGLWLSKHLAPLASHGVLLNIKAPRNKQGDMEFD